MVTDTALTVRRGTLAQWCQVLWRQSGLIERGAALVLCACLVIAGLGLRLWPAPGAPGADADSHLRNLIEICAGSDADRTNPADRLMPPLSRLEHGELSLLGTDELGRSLLLRLTCAIGTSVLVACSAALIAVVIGVAWGVTAALAGGRCDDLMMRVNEVTAAVPNVVVIVILVSALQRFGAVVIFASMGLLYWQTISRMVRARVLRLRGEAYVEASRAMGAGLTHRLRVHLLPGVMPTVVTYGAPLLPRLIMLESLLSYLGVSGGASAAHSFGRIIAGVTATMTPLSRSWWPVLIPMITLAMFLLALNVVLDAVAARAQVSR
jgi:ABC-type dipeptide/oligopeptide/nickel transport system permease subunit